VYINAIIIETLFGRVNILGGNKGGSGGGERERRVILSGV
jgi:hypothetical protein